jgi:SecD/SecF fusion protein
MRNKSIIIAFTVIVSLLCLYYLSFTFVGRKVEKDATEFATVNGVLNPKLRQQYLDSVWTSPAFSFLGIDYTYKQIKQNEVKLGLDLMGGMHVTMEVSAADILDVLSGNNQNQAFQESLKEALQAQKNSQKPYVDLFYEIWKSKNTGISLAAIFSNKSNKDRISYTSSDEEVLRYLRDEVQSTIDRSFEILRTRIDKFGVTQPNIQQLQGTNRIQIELPGVEDAERARKILQSVAKLEFYEVWEMDDFAPYFNKLNDFLVKEENLNKGKKGAGTSKSEAKPKSQSNVSEGDSAQSSDDLASALMGDENKDADSTGLAQDDSLGTKQSSTLASLFRGVYGGIGALTKDTGKINRLLARPEVAKLFPSNMKFLWAVKPEPNAVEPVLTLYAVKKGRDNKAVLEGDVIVDARQDFDDKGQPEIIMQMNATGARAWKRITGANIGKRIAIVLDNYVYSAPVVRGEIPNGNSSISGNYTIEEAKDMANILKAGKLPVPTRIVEEEVVGPTLGAESIQKGLTSIFIGFVVVLLFMIAYYSHGGVIADLAVLLNVFLIVGILVPVQAVLTLPGIAGIVLTIGMAVDANVLINERIRDELRNGVNIKQAIVNGYNAAQSSIFDANITTLLAGLVLFYFGSGPVQGFATTLIIGIFTSLFTSFYLTRIMVEYRLSKGSDYKVSTPFSANLFKNVNYDFVGKRKIAYAVSSIILVVGAVYISLFGLNFGVDFKGGWKYLVEFDRPVTTDEVRNALNQPLGGFPEVKTFGAKEKVQITTSYLIDDVSEDAAEKVGAKINEGLSKISGAKYEILSTSKVGPTVANDIKVKAYYSIIFALLLIFAYIWLRFRKWEYAMGATIAVFHDAAVVVVFYSIFREILPFSLEIDQNFIAAILTVVGYSVNDTVVVFDRVREFFKDSALDADTGKVVNKALNDTFSRTIVTSLTLLLVVVILLFFGGETIRGLSFALFIGVIVGTYSTVFIAIPVVVDARKKAQKQLSLSGMKTAKA